MGAAGGDGGDSAAGGVELTGPVVAPAVDGAVFPDGARVPGADRQGVLLDLKLGLGQRIGNAGSQHGCCLVVENEIAGPGVVGQPSDIGQYAGSVGSLGHRDRGRPEMVDCRAPLGYGIGGSSRECEGNGFGSKRCD